MIETRRSRQGWRALVKLGKEGKFLTGYHATEAEAIKEAKDWLRAKGD